MAGYDGSIRISTQISTDSAKKSLAVLSQMITGTAEEIASLHSKMDALKGKEFESDDYKNLRADLAEAEKELSALVAKQTEWESIGITSGGVWDTLNGKIADASDRVDSLKEKMYELEEAGKAFTLGENTQEYAGLELQLRLEEQALAVAMERYQIAKRFGDPYARLSQALGDLRDRLNGIAHPVRSARKAFLNFGENVKAMAAGVAASILSGLVHPLRTVARLSSTVAKSTAKVFSGIVSMSKKAGSALKNIASGFLSMGRSAWKVSGKAGSALKSIVSRLLNIGGSARKAGGTVGSMVSRFKGLAMSLLIFNQISRAFRAMAGAIKEGFGNLYKDSEGFRASVDGLRANVLTLKNALATAFLPIVQVAIPYIQQMVAWLTKAADAVAQFMAALTGQKMYMKAVKQTAAALKEQNKEQNRQLSGLDRMNNLTSDKGSGGDGAGGGNMFEEAPVTSGFSDMLNKLMDMWKNADFSDLGKKIGELIRDALNGIDWESIGGILRKIGKSLSTFLNGLVDVPGLALSIGRSIGEAINAGVGMINEFLDGTNWSAIGAFIGNGLNAIVDTVDFGAIGHAFAQAWNAVFDLIGWVAMTFEWTTFGAKLADGINTAIRDFKWKENGENLSIFVTGMLDALLTVIKKTEWGELIDGIGDFVNAIDWPGILSRVTEGLVLVGDTITEALRKLAYGPKWAEIGSELAKSANQLVAGIKWKELGDIVAEGLNGIVDAIGAFITGTSWNGLATGLKDFLVAGFAGLEWEDAGKVLGDMIVDALDVALVVIGEAEEWGRLIDKIGKFINAIDWPGILDRLTEGLVKVGDIITEALRGIAYGPEWTEIGGKLANSVKQLAAGIKWEELGNIIAEGLNGIVDALDTLIADMDWYGLTAHLVDFLVTALIDFDWGMVGRTLSDLIVGALDIALAVVGETDWGGLLQGVLEAIADIIGNLNVWGILGRLALLIAEIIVKIPGIIIGAVGGIMDLIGGIFEAIGLDCIGGLFRGIGDALANVGAWIEKNFVRPVVDAVKICLGIHSPSTVFAEIGRFLILGLMEGIKSLVDAVKKIWDGMKEAAVSIWNAVKTAVMAAVSGMGSAISSAMTFISAAWSTAWNAVRSVAVSAWDGIKATISGAIGSIRSVLSSALNLIKAVWNGSWADMKRAVIDIFNGIWGGIKGAINSIIGGIETMVNSVIGGINAMTGALNKVKIDIPDWVPGVGGKKFGIDIGQLGSVSIPRLATGTVVPPNREFLAVLGDNKREPEIVSPVAVMEKSFEDVLRRSGLMGGAREITVRVPVEIDGNVIFEIVKKLDAEQFSRTQVPSFQM